MSVIYQLQIAIDHPTNVDQVVDFFEGTAYEPKRVDDRTVALTPPERVSARLARREVEIYLRVLERVRPGVGATLLAQRRA